MYVQVGGSGPLFGLLGVLVVELLQGWKWVQRPWVELVKLIVMIVIVLGKLSGAKISPVCEMACL